MMVNFAVACFALLAAFITAEKDINYYPDGLEDPSAQNPMYWSDSYNILNDISQFDKLYVTFHNCAWSPYENGGENPCGIAQSDSTAYWYMGYTECFRANAAFSLYGILAGEEDKGCTAATFINSFFTTQGVEYFTESLIAAGYQFSNDDDSSEYPAGVTSQCFEGSEDGSDSGYSVSYGLSCSSKNFVERNYNGTYCDAKKALAVTDDLLTFNEEIQKAKCVAIYDASSSSNNNRQLEGGNGDSLNVLYYSRACSVRQSPGVCPDPYNKLHSYASTNERALENNNHGRRQMVKTAFSWILLVLGCIFIMFALFVVYRRRRRAQVQSDGAQQKSRRASKTAEDSGEKKRQSFWKRIRPKSRNSTMS